MISDELRAKIRRLFFAEHWKVGTISAELGIHHDAVHNAIESRSFLAPALRARALMLDPYREFIHVTLEKHPRLRATRLHEMIRDRGYQGSVWPIRRFVARMRPSRHEAFLRLSVLPGEQAQVDWASFGSIIVGRAKRGLSCFLMVLSWSRALFARFYLDQTTESFMRGHLAAFDAFGGVPRTILYDNLKSAVLEREGDAIRFHPTLLELAGHYRFLPKPVAPARGNEKGRVERAIRYVRDSFFAAREWSDLADLNAQALAWCDGQASDRPCPEDRSRSVREVFADEEPRLLALPDDEFPTDEREDVEIGKTPYARFDLNDYSLPHRYTRCTLTVVASIDTVRVLDGLETIAMHPRSWDRGKQLEIPEHIQDLQTFKRKGREHRTLDRLHHVAPHSQKLLNLVAERGGNIGSLTRRLSLLLERFTAAELDDAIARALAQGTPHLGAIRQLLDKARSDRGEPPPVRLPLPDDPRLDRLVVQPHSLATYDQLRKDPSDDTL
jgi:transposase